MSAAFDDRTVNLDGSPETFAELCDVLGAPTRVEILTVLKNSPEPLSINEVARRVGVDASPARMHLEVLTRAGLADEVTEAQARRRRRLFTTRVTNARLILEGANRVRRAVDHAIGDAPPKTVQRLERKLAALSTDMQKLQARARQVQSQLEAAWEKAGRRVQVRSPKA